MRSICSMHTHPMKLFRFLSGVQKLRSRTTLYTGYRILKERIFLNGLRNWVNKFQSLNSTCLAIIHEVRAIILRILVLLCPPRSRPRTRCQTETRVKQLLYGQQFVAYLIQDQTSEPERDKCENSPGGRLNILLQWEKHNVS